MGFSIGDLNPKNWADDAWDAGTKVVKGGGNVLGSIGDALVNEESWGRVMSGDFSHLGSDLTNMALDASILIPGAGLAGGAARIGARQGAKMLTKEAAEAVAKKEIARTALRSPANNAVRGSIDDLLGLTTKGALARKGAAEGTEYATKKATREIGRKAYADAAKKASTKEGGALRSQMNRMAGKQEAGIGRKIGFGQTKRRTLMNAALTGGANLGTAAYDAGLFDGFGGGDENPNGPGGATGPGGGAGGPGFYFVLPGGGESVPVPASYFTDPAGFMAQNGLARGTQIQYIE